MLVLTRKQQEKIRINDNIVVTVLRVKGNTVRLGIEAPREIRVVRSELPPKDEFGGPAAASESESRRPIEVGAEEEAEAGETQFDAARPGKRTLKEYLAAAL